ncbi:hypothetical protein ACT6QH_04080 [Xanthobacter sp. TB0139]|uniref:hypothetical protein n=1 Tax=Xanthobacter sp. TB0139 TaxID=3459178 RepID=UPI004039A90B
MWDEIAEVIGTDAALKLFEARGGGRVFIPAHAPDGHWMVELLGRESADALCGYFQQLSSAGRERGFVLDLPRGPTGVVAATVIPSLQSARRKMEEALAAGKSADEAARISGLTRRTGYRTLQRLRQKKQSNHNR